MVSLLTGNVVTNYAGMDTNLNATINSSMAESLIKAEKIQVMTSLTLLVGIFQVIMGFTGLGVLSSFFSDAFVSSYTCGSAIHVLVSQIKNLLGIKNTTRYQGVGTIPKTVINLAANVPSANWKTIIFSICCCIYLSLMKEVVNPKVKRRFKLEIPSEIILARIFHININ